MLPNQGQGLGMVVEDAAALAVVLRDMPPGPSAEQLEERLSIFEKIRKPRASVAQLLSSVPYYEDPLKTLLPQLLEHLTLARLPASGAPNDVRPWFYKYDVFKEAEKALAAQQI
jgi:salicylate hydroxylase